MHPGGPLPVETPSPRPVAGKDRVTVVLAWDQSFSLSAFPASPAQGQLLVLETRAKVRALPWHRQKLTLVVSSLRHLVEDARARGFHVEHRVADDYAGGVEAFHRWARLARLHLTEPREWAVDRRLRALSLPLTIHPDGGPGGHFLLTRDEFASWAASQTGPLRMDRFYVFMRKRLGVLLDSAGRPEGGSWSLDALNRKHARGVEIPAVPWHRPDALTRRVMRWVNLPSVGQWGALEPFGWPVTRAEALAWLEDFVSTRLERFGPYEDAIRDDERALFHSLLSVPLNLSLLHPREVVDAAVEAYRRRRIPLSSAEGFIRQIIGWREFIRGVYWQLMPGLRGANQLGARRPLPAYFWDWRQTDMRCVAGAVRSVEETGYTHHINRLMVLCNHATLAGVDPHQVSQWFWAAFADAYEWVELPNVVGMGMFGTDAFTTKPYVASAAYIKRLSGLPAKGRGPASAAGQAPCATCRYDPDLRTGPDACPFNALYWRFMDRHRARLAQNVRMRALLSTLDRLSDLPAIHRTAEAHLETLAPAAGYTFDEDAG